MHTHGSNADYTTHPQGRLPEIDVLQKQISRAHEELSDVRCRLEEQRAAGAAREKGLAADKQALQGQLEALTHTNERLALEASNSGARAAKHEKQLEELYDLLNTNQGARVWVAVVGCAAADAAVDRLVAMGGSCG
jgi:chromosome segregation ATPase